MTDQRTRILGIDDKPEHLLLMGAALAADFELQIASSGATGFALAMASPPDLILLNVKMPAMEGVQTYRHLKAAPTLQDVPVIFVNAFSELDSEMQELASGAADYLGKPINVEIARLRIHNALERERLRKEVQAQRALLRFEVAERENAQRALYESEHRFRNFFETNSSVMLLIDPASSEIIDANASAAAYYGYPRTELVSMPVSAINTLPPEHIAEQRLSALRGEQNCFQFPHRLASGDVREVEVYTTAIASDGRPLLLSIVHDITERKNAEEMLRKLSIAVEQSPASVVITDLEGSIQYVNPCFSKVTGYSPSEVIGKNPRILQSGQTSEEIYLEMWSKLSGGEAWRGELLNKRRNGELYWEEINVAPVKNTVGTVTHYVAVKTDITERVLLAAAREDALSTLQKIASRVPGLIYQYRLRPDGSGYFPFASEAMWEIYRLSPEDVRADASQVFDRIHPDDYDACIASILKSAQDLTPWHFEYRVRFDDGTVRWLLGNALPAREADGATLWHGFITDITQRKQADAKLAASETRLQTLIHAIPDLVWLKDPEGIYLACNPRFERFFGACEKDIVGKKDYDFVDQELADFFRQNDLAAMAATSTHVNEEWVTFADDGHRELLETSKTPMFDAQGNLSGVLGISHDISARKQAEEKLRVSDLALKAVSQGVLISGTDGRILTVNDAFSTITGYNNTEILGQTCRFVQGPLTDPKTVAAIRLALKNASEFSGEILNYRKDGTAFWNDLTISPVLGEQGQLTHFIGITRDITDRKQVEAALQESEAYKLAILNSLPNEIAVVDLDGVIRAVNEPWRRFSVDNSSEPNTPASHTEIGTNYLEICAAGPASTSPEVLDAHQGIRAVLDGSLPSFSLEYPCDSPTQQRWFTMNVLPLGQASRNGAVIAHTNITERKQMEQQVRQLAFYDPLTKLPNRRLLNDRLGQAMASSKRSGGYGAVMILDLDNFKPLNDTHGHLVGDLLLIEVANRLTLCLREMDTVARFGGDEFVVMLRDLNTVKAASIAQAGIIAEKIRIRLSEPYLLTVSHEAKPDTTVVHRCTASIGVVVFIGNEASQDDVFTWADTAMYQAKEAGRNLVKFHDSKA
ncbi:MAG: PAS domain S-box protein [Burkholderiaceae bacterium]